MGIERIVDDAEPEDLAEKNLVARSAALRRVVDEARLVASSDATVLLTGESGTGKEVLAALLGISRRGLINKIKRYGL